MLIRSSVVNDRVLAANDSRVQRLLDTYQDNGKVMDELFLGTLSRQPLPEERTTPCRCSTRTARKARRTCNGRC